MGYHFCHNVLPLKHHTYTVSIIFAVCVFCKQSRCIFATCDFNILRKIISIHAFTGPAVVQYIFNIAIYTCDIWRVVFFGGCECYFFFLSALPFEIPSRRGRDRLAVRFTTKASVCPAVVLFIFSFVL